jgi:hypothetical protein
MQEDEPTAFVTYEKFEKQMMTVLIEKQYQPDPEDRLRQAFLVLQLRTRRFNHPTVAPAAGC